MSGASSEHVQSLAAEILELSKNDETIQLSSGPSSKLLVRARELVSAAQSPRDHSMSMTWPLVEASTIRTLLHLGALQAIPKSGSISLADLSAASGAQASLLERLLRVLVGSGFIIQHPDGSYSHSSVSEIYGTDAGNMATLYKTLFDELRVMASLPEYLNTHNFKEPEGELAMTHNPNTWFYGQEGKTVFEINEQNPEKLRGFQELMQMAARFRPFTGYYDFGKFKTEEADRAVLVDVGGADGTMIARVLEAHPEIKPEQCVLEDRDQVVELGRQNPELPKGVQFQAHDFFTPQPVKDAKAYLFRAVCHDWSDQMVIRILSNTVSAMGEDSKLLIADYVLAEGGADVMATYADVMMLCVGGKERTKANFEAVLDAAGLKLDGIYSAGPTTSFAIVEASLK